MEIDIKINLKRNGNDNAKNEAKENLININDKDGNNTTSNWKQKVKNKKQIEILAIYLIQIICSRIIKS